MTFDEFKQLPGVRHVVALVATKRGRFIAVFLVLQLAIPLRYYAWSRDPHDDRFAWRDDSSSRAASCVPDLSIDGKKVELANEFDDAWIRLAERGRFAVVEAMGAELCRKHASADVEVALHCKYVDRPAEDWGHYNICKVPLLYGD